MEKRIIKKLLDYGFILIAPSKESPYLHDRFEKDDLDRLMDYLKDREAMEVKHVRA